MYVADGTVVRVRSVDPDLSKRRENDRGYADVPVSRKPPATAPRAEFAGERPTGRTVAACRWELP